MPSAPLKGVMCLYRVQTQTGMTRKIKRGKSRYQRKRKERKINKREKKRKQEERRAREKGENERKERTVSKPTRLPICPEVRTVHLSFIGDWESQVQDIQVIKE